MKILFLLGDNAKNSVERLLAAEAQKLIGKDAEVLWHTPATPIGQYGELDGVWIFTHEEDGGCPQELFAYLEESIGALGDVPAVATGIGGKEGAMNAVTEIIEFFSEHGGRYLEDSEPLCIPLRSAKFDLDSDERLDLFFLVDEFVKYCGMDDSESRKIGFQKVVEDYFVLLKALLPEGGKPASLAFDGKTVRTDAGDADLSLDTPKTRELIPEIESLTEDYEIEEDELKEALLEKISKEW